jgi:hypothetical protein
VEWADLYTNAGVIASTAETAVVLGTAVKVGIPVVAGHFVLALPPNTWSSPL